MQLCIDEGFQTAPHYRRADNICQKPAYRDRPPYADNAEGGRDGICQSDARPERNDGQQQRHFGAIYPAEVAVKQEKHADTDVKRALYPQVAHADLHDLAALCEDLHKLRGEDVDGDGDSGAKACGERHRAFNTAADTPTLARAEILRNEERKRAAELLRGHIGESVDLDGDGEGRHNGRAETVDQPLYHQNAEIHDRLLHAGGGGHTRDLTEKRSREQAAAELRTQRAFADEREHRQSRAGERLRNEGRPRRAFYAHRKFCHKQYVEQYIHSGRYTEKNERRYRIAQTAEHEGVVII